MKRMLLFTSIIFIMILTHASVFIVDTTGSEGDTLQYYIDAAASFPMFNPDTILLMPGTYHLYINGDTGLIMRDSVMLIGLGATACTLTAMDAGDSLSANHVVSFWNLGDCYSGLKYLTITGANTSEPGAGIFIKKSNPFIDSCIIVHNNTTHYGGGIMIYDSASPTINGSYIAFNKAQLAGGIYIDSFCSPVITNSMIAVDSAFKNVGGICALGANTQMTGNTIAGNNGAGAGGIAIWGGHVDIDSCTIQMNTATSANGGGILLMYCDGIINNSEILTNYADSAGGGLCIIGDSTITVSNNRIKNNVAAYGGGIALTESATPIISNNIIDSNSATVGGGIMAYDACSPGISNNSISYNTTSQAGGGLAFYIDCSPDIINNTIRENSTVFYGGGIFMDDHCDPYINDNSIIENSSSFYGAGIHLQFYSDPVIENNLFEGNDAMQYGGAIFVYDFSYPIITDNDILYNSAKTGGGGVFVYSDAFADLSRNVIWGNVGSTGGGGAIAAAENVQVNVHKCVIAGNYGGEGGAIFDSTSAEINIDSCLIIDNGNDDNELSGFAYMSNNSDPAITMQYSNVYYNTYQPDAELSSTSLSPLLMEHNYWHETDSSDIDAILDANVDFMPFETSFINNVPGEPLSIDSVIAYSDSLYATVCDSMNAPGALYVSIFGNDRESGMKEAAIAILKSNVYNTGVAVALMETDTNTGVYQGTVDIFEYHSANDIRNDDIWNILRVDSLGDTIFICANMDTTECCSVLYKIDLSGVITTTIDNENFCMVPSVLNNNSEISYSITEKSTVRAEIIDVTGRVISIPVNAVMEPGQYSISSKELNIERTGIYFVRFMINDRILSKKTMLF